MGGSRVTPTFLAPPAPSVENAGLSKGQEGSGLLPEYPGADANVQVGSSGHLAVKPTWYYLQGKRPTQRSSNTGEAIITVRGFTNGQLEPEGCSEFKGHSGSRELGLSLMTPIRVTTTVRLCSLLSADFPSPSEAFAN